MKHKTEWLVRQRDRIGKTEQQNARMTKKGDVIVVKEVPCVWSQAEIMSDDWVIIKTDMELIDAMAYMEREPGFYEEKPLLKIRNKNLDFEALMATVPARFPEQAQRVIPNRNVPFDLPKEYVAEFTKVKPRAPRRND